MTEQRMCFGLVVPLDFLLLLLVVAPLCPLCDSAGPFTCLF